jgi:hypothetical protein
MPDKVVHVFAETGAELMSHLKQALGEDVVVNDLKITQESVDQKVLEWNQKQAPEATSVLDFFKEYKIEIFPTNVKNFDSRQKVMEYIGDKIDFNMGGPALEDSDQVQDSMVLDLPKDQQGRYQDSQKEGTKKDM